MTDSTGIDLAPMLDFVLNLLIFFIITAVFFMYLGIAGARPGGAAGGPASAKETGSISLVVKHGGEVVVDGRAIDVRAVRAIDVRAVRANIERLHAQKPEWGVMVTAEQDAETGLLVQVIDQVREGGVQNVSFGTSSK